MKSTFRQRGRLAAALGKVSLVILGVGLALGIMELSLRLNPNWVPDGIRVNPPVRRVQAFQDETYDVTLSEGDLFHWMRGSIAPLQPQEDNVVAQVHLVTDANGFRNSSFSRTSFRIVALGDSFTFGGNAAVPWPQRLAEYSAIEVLNLGESGSGPQQQRDALRKYGLKAQPQWVIMAYFEGNDMYDAAAYAQANPFLLTRVAKHLIIPGEELSKEDESSARGLDPGSDPAGYQYPIVVGIDNAELEMAFLSYYISWLALDRWTIESSRNYLLVMETIQEVRDMAEVAGAGFLLVYVPSKPHVYLPFITESETLTRVFSGVPTVELDGSGYLQITTQTATPEMTFEHMGDQVLALTDFAAEHDINLLDLTPHFAAAAATGAELYYPFDTHWNQNGHDLATETIARYIEAALAPKPAIGETR